MKPALPPWTYCTPLVEHRLLKKTREPSLAPDRPASRCRVVRRSCVVSKHVSGDLVWCIPGVAFLLIGGHSFPQKDTASALHNGRPWYGRVLRFEAWHENFLVHILSGCLELKPWFESHSLPSMLPTKLSRVIKLKTVGCCLSTLSLLKLWLTD